VAIKAGELRRGVDFQIERADKVIAGVVVDSRGTPIEGATVEVEDARGGVGRATSLARAMMGERARTDVEGAFVMNGLGDGPYHVRASAPGQAPGEIGNVSGGTRGLRLRLAAGGSVGGVVIDSGGSPVQDFTVEAELTDRATVLSPLGSKLRLTVRNAAGQFEVGGLPGGDYRLLVNGPAGEIGLLDGIRLQDGEQRRGLRVVLEAGLVLTGVVLAHPENQPLVGARVTLGGNGPFMTRSTGSDGSFRFEGVRRGGRVVVSVQDSLGQRIPERVKVNSPVDAKSLPPQVVRLVAGTLGEWSAEDMLGLTAVSQEGAAVIRTILPGGIAASAGVHVGDRLLTIGNVPASGLGEMGLESLLAGEPGAPVELVLERAGGTRRTVTLLRATRLGGGESAPAASK
jgi:hypothetical protein